MLAKRIIPCLDVTAGRVVKGVGADPDIVIAAAKAYLSALSRLRGKSEKVKAQDWI